MHPTLRFTLAAASFALLSAPLVAQPPAATALRPLLKLHENAILDAGPAIVRSVDQDLFVAGDGTLVSVTVAADLLTGGGFASTIIRGVGSPAAVDALRAALFQGRIGTLHGVCGAELLPLGSSFIFGISWFGRGSHSSQFTVTNEGSTSGACSSRERGVLQAIEDFQTAVIADPATAISSSACVNDRQCPSGLLCCYPCGFPGCNNACSRPAANGSCLLIP